MGMVISGGGDSQRAWNQRLGRHKGAAAPLTSLGIPQWAFWKFAELGLLGISV